MTSPFPLFGTTFIPANTDLDVLATNIANATVIAVAAAAAVTSGTWTPVDTSGASLAFTDLACTWVRIGLGAGSLYIVTGSFQYPSTASGATASIGGLPGEVTSSILHAVAPMYVNAAYSTPSFVQSPGGAIPASANFLGTDGATGQTNANLSLKALQFTLSYVSA